MISNIISNAVFVSAAADEYDNVNVIKLKCAFVTQKKLVVHMSKCASGVRMLSNFNDDEMNIYHVPTYVTHHIHECTYMYVSISTYIGKQKLSSAYEHVFLSEVAFYNTMLTLHIVGICKVLLMHVICYSNSLP